MVKRKSQALLNSDSDSSGSGSDIEKGIAKKRAVGGGLKNIYSDSDSSDSSDDNDWDSKRKSAGGGGAESSTKKPAKRGGRRSTSGTHSESDRSKDQSPRKASVAQSDLEEGEVSSSEVSDDSSMEEFDDGYDDDFMGDAEDKKRLNAMTEKERETEIFKRIERREEMKTRFDIEKKLRLAKKKETKAMMKREMPTLSPNYMDAKERSKERKKTVEGKVDKKTQAMDLLKAKREAKSKRDAEKEKLRQEQERKRRDKQDEDGSDDEDFNFKKDRDKSKKKLNADDIYSSGSDSDSDRKENVKKPSRRSSSSGSSSDSESEDEREKKPKYIDSMDDLRKIELSRARLAKWIHYPFFEKLAKGCFVRIGIGNPGVLDNKPVYRLGEIVDVIETNRIYSLERTRTNKGIKVRHGKDEKVFRAEYVSNTPFTITEFEKWKNVCETQDVALPTLQDIEKKLQEIKDADNYQHKEEDIDIIIQEKQKFKNSPVNFAVRKTELMKQREEALEKGEESVAAELQREIQDVDDRAKEIDKMRTSSLKSISYINERNRKKNIEEAEKAIKEECKANKGKTTEDPFTRRNTRPKMAKIANNKLGLFDLMDPNASLAFNSTPLANSLILEDQIDGSVTQSPISTDSSTTKDILSSIGNDINKQIADELDLEGSNIKQDLFNCHDFDIKLDIDSKLPISLPIVARPSVPQFTDPSPRRSMNLEDYKRKRGLI